MIEISKKCDNCNEELIVDSQYPTHYTLELRAVDTGTNTSGMTFAVHVMPPFTGTKHFCNKDCLKQWLVKDNNGI